MPRATKSNTRRKFRGGSMLSALVPSSTNPSLPGGLSSVLPTTSWDSWTPESRQWGPTSEAPAPLANGGLYTNPQSTAVWASSPFPATQNAFALEAAKISGLPEVGYHQRPNDNFGASFSPMVGSPITPAYYSASGPMGPIMQGGSKRRFSNKRRSQKATKSKRNRYTRR